MKEEPSEGSTIISLKQPLGVIVTVFMGIPVYTVVLFIDRDSEVRGVRDEGKSQVST